MKKIWIERLVSTIRTGFGFKASAHFDILSVTKTRYP